MVTTSIRLESDILEKIKFIGENYGKNKTEIIRDFLRDKAEDEYNRMMEMIEFGLETDRILQRIKEGKDKTYSYEDFLKL